MKTVTVTWMDGKQETYRCDLMSVADDILSLDFYKYPRRDEPAPRIPLVNVRTWTVAE